MNVEQKVYFFMLDSDSPEPLWMHIIASFEKAYRVHSDISLLIGVTPETQNTEDFAGVSALLDRCCRECGGIYKRLYDRNDNYDDLLRSDVYIVGNNIHTLHYSDIAAENSIAVRSGYDWDKGLFRYSPDTVKQEDKKPLVSICIPTFNRAPYLKQSLDSIISQNEFQSGDVEIVISDNGSTDETEILAKYYSEQHSGISYYRNQVNLTDGNFPMVMSRGSGVLRKLSNDTLMYRPGALAYICSMVRKYAPLKPVMQFGNIPDRVNRPDILFDRTGFIRYHSFNMTWIGAFTMWEDDCEGLEDEVDDAMHGDHLWQVHKLMDLITQRGAVAACDEGVCVNQMVHKKGISSETWDIFHTSFLGIIGKYLSMKGKEFIEMDMLYNLFSQTLMCFDLDIVDTTNAEGVKKDITDYYKKKPYWIDFCEKYDSFIEEERRKRGHLQNVTQMREKTDSSFPKVSIIILSYNTVECTRQCLESVKEYTDLESCQVIVVDNASDDGSQEYLRTLDWITLIENRSNIGVCGGRNAGIKAADSSNDIYLLDSDAVLTKNALPQLQKALYEDDSIGSAGSISDENLIDTNHPYEYRMYLEGYSQLIKRSVLEKTGLFDEQFYPGGVEDIDIGLRILKSGHLNVLCHNSMVRHDGRRSFEEYKKKTGLDHDIILESNKSELSKKIGIIPWYYMNPRKDLVSLVSEDENAPLKFLELGCGMGGTACYIRTVFPNAEYHGLEYSEKAAAYAKPFGKVSVGDAETFDYEANYPADYFDYAIFGDVLEHLHEPSDVLKKIYRCIKPGGRLIISMPNVKHWSVIIPLLQYDQFTYVDAGILDRTHLKMYTGVEIYRMITNSGYKVINNMYLTGGTPDQDTIDKLNGLAQVFNLDDLTTFMAYQYVFVAEKPMT